MPLELVTVPCLSDNYAFLVHDAETGDTAVIDVPEAAPIIAALNARNWTLSHVLLTHHHYDHVDGLPDLLATFPAHVVGARADAHRLPPLDTAISEGDHITIGGETIDIIDVSGHTIDHIAFHFPQSKFVFTGDSLMAMGCGRLFEGTPAQMFASLAKLAILPGDTTVCSGHEYTQSNAKFAMTIETQNPALIARMNDIVTARAENLATVPSLLATELATNPFLRAHIDTVQSAVGMPNGDPAAVFAEIRARKDNF